MKQRRWIIALACAAIGLAVTLGLHRQAQADFALGSTRLSAPEQVCDIEPRSAISPDGQWLGAGWIRGYRVAEGCGSRGQAVVRWATEGTAQTGWSDPVTLSLPSSESCAVHVDISLNGITLYAAVSYWQNCNSAGTDSGVRYFTCNMTTGVCHDHGNAVYQPGIDDRRISDVRLALDAQARPHIAFARGNHSLENGVIMYARLTGPTWSTPVQVSIGQAIGGFYRPDIAVSEGRAHMVWERHRTDADSRAVADVQYRYCEVDTSTCYPEDNPINYPYPPALLESTYALPTLAARDNRVILVWNVCADVNPGVPCSAFYLLYTRSNDNGRTMPLGEYPKEVGTDSPIQFLTQSQRRYAGSDTASQVSAYTTHARPVVTLSEAGLPRVAWQVQVDGGYVISTTYAITGTENTFTWAPKADGWQIGEGHDIRVLPSILLPDPALDDTGLHVVYMNPWLEQGTSSRSQVYYDYVGTRRPNLEAGTPTGDHTLPTGRAVPLNARVLDAAGDGLPGVEVTFSTDHGSFNYMGYGVETLQATSDARGEITVTLYNNLPGSANVRAWIDSTTNGVWDAGEPTTAFTHTWSSSTTPALDVGTTWDKWAMPGDLITATLRNHPHESPNFTDRAAPYLVWLCPEAGAASGEAQLAGPLGVDVATWSLENLVLKVPWDADGSYYLETREDGEVTPCTDDLRVARSATFTIDSAPPAGTAWLQISKNRPAAGDRFDATLKDHAPESYEIWWCPAVQDAAPISLTVASDVSVSADQEPVTTVEAPQGIDGIYRLESHRQGQGACGQAATREGVSPLIQPSARIFLPLVSRQ